MRPKEAIIDKILSVPKLVGLLRKQTGPNTLYIDPERLECEIHDMRLSNYGLGALRTNLSNVVISDSCII